MDTADVLVIGGGIAGVAAALAAATRGASVLLVRRGPGVTAMTTGGWLDAPPAPLVDALAAAGLPLLDAPAALPHPDGTLLRFTRAPASHARAGFGSGAERALVCGVAGLPGFRATALATLWAAALDAADGALEPVTLVLHTTPSAGWSPVSLAAELQREPSLLATPLMHAVRERGAARAVVPAVLGLEAHATVHDAVEQTVGAAVGEALGTAPSLPGWRLDLALQAVLAAAGVPLIAGAARLMGPCSVTVTTDAGARELRAGAIVLAAGKFAGGGIAADTRLRDAVTGADAGIDRLGRRFSDAADALTLTDPLRSASQALLTAGVEDVRTRPPIFVAGSIRRGIETASLGLGAAATDGWNAGLEAAAAAGT